MGRLWQKGGGKPRGRGAQREENQFGEERNPEGEERNPEEEERNPEEEEKSPEEEERNPKGEERNPEGEERNPEGEERNQREGKPKGRGTRKGGSGRETEPGKASERGQPEEGGGGGGDDADDPSLVLAGSRVMLLDDSNNVSSLYNKRTVWTRSYWDNLASLAPLLSHELGSGGNAPLPGPVALLGLAGGSVARIIRTQWPEVGVQAWEIDLVSTVAGGRRAGMGDRPIDDATAGQQQFSGIIVDLFSGGAALPQLADEATWRHLKNHLSPEGRVLINCGGPSSCFGDYLKASSEQSQSAEPEAKEGGRMAEIVAAARGDP
ncbi:unnamed protein product, partial [Closterium sp. NIES-53]